jgi:hypothetical protein
VSAWQTARLGRAAFSRRTHINGGSGGLGMWSCGRIRFRSYTRIREAGLGCCWAHT